MKQEYDFSKAERGRFFAQNAKSSLPVYLEPDVSDFMSDLANRKEIDIQELINEWLRVNIRLVQSVKTEEVPSKIK